MEANATNAYVVARTRIDEQLKLLQKLLHAHANKAAAQPGNWGHAGSLGHVSEILDQAVLFLGGEEESR